MRILSLSTHDEPCGIGDYNSSLKTALEALGHSCDIIRIRRHEPDTLSETLSNFASAVGRYDLAMIQHEWAFFDLEFEISARTFARLLRSMPRTGPPLAIFLHSNLPDLPRVNNLRPFGPKARKRAAKRAVIRAMNRAPRGQVFVHGSAARADYIGHGISPDRISDIVFPMNEVGGVAEPRKIIDGDTVILAIFGFVEDYKGYEAALNALCLLPDNVKLVIAGGPHPHNPRVTTLDSIYGFVNTGVWPRPTMPSLPLQLTCQRLAGLRDRIEVTGHIPQDRIAETIGDADIVLAAYTSAPAGSAALGQTLSLGRPVIASALEPFLDIKRRSDCLRLVAPSCPFELAEAIRQMIPDHRERMRLHSAALAYARKHSFNDLAQCVVDFAARRTGSRPLKDV